MYIVHVVVPVIFCMLNNRPSSGPMSQWHGTTPAQPQLSGSHAVRGNTEAGSTCRPSNQAPDYDSYNHSSAAQCVGHSSMAQHSRYGAVDRGGGSSVPFPNAVRGNRAPSYYGRSAEQQWQQHGVSNHSLYIYNSHVYKLTGFFGYRFMLAMYM